MLDGIIVMVGIIVPPWCQTCVLGRNTEEDELFFPREDFSLSAIVEKDSCLPSEARLDSPERRSRKGKSSLEERKVSETVLSVLGTHNWHHRGIPFFLLLEVVQP